VPLAQPFLYHGFIPKKYLGSPFNNLIFQGLSMKRLEVEEG